ncbi:MAG: carboxypeptidase-like regulatory domain-containing protein [Acidobacteriota bacterium]|nr:carboxypeptidase-like regulatory domain-containing protein [Acidobacteriota bacterium]
MKWALGASILLLALNCAAWQFQVPIGGNTSSGSSAGRKSTRVTSRLLTGTVLDKSDQPVSNAVVYLKNTKTLAVKTFIAEENGTFRFPELSPNVDYEVYAQRNGRKSDTKVLSQFDDREKPNINLRIDVTKPAPADKTDK